MLFPNPGRKRPQRIGCEVTQGVRVQVPLVSAQSGGQSVACGLSELKEGERLGGGENVESDIRAGLHEGLGVERFIVEQEEYTVPPLESCKASLDALLRL